MKTLEELQAHPPRACTAADVGITITAKESGAEAEAEAITASLDAYFSDFCAPADFRCVRCDARLDGLLGTFRWGLAHGHGYCGREGCGYPVTAYHCPKDGDGEIFDRRLEILLQPLPKHVGKRGASPQKTDAGAPPRPEEPTAS